MLWTVISPQCSLTSYYNSTPGWNILNFLVWFLFLFVPDYVKCDLRLKITLFEKVEISKLLKYSFFNRCENYITFIHSFSKIQKIIINLQSPYFPSYPRGYLARVLFSFGSFQVCDVNKIKASSLMRILSNSTFQLLFI